MARMRMSVLYDRSVAWGGLVVGTGNKTESLIGYTTLFGDSACAFNPIGDLYKSQVRQLSADIGVPEAIIRKAPSADLWPGQTDETEAGFTYHELDRLLFWRIDKRRSVDEMVAMGFERATVERVDRMVAGAEFKRQVPADREARAADRGGRLPVSAAPAGLGPTLTVTAATTRDPAPGGTLYVVATPIGNLGDVTLRALEVLRAVPLIAAEDTRISGACSTATRSPTRAVSYHARSGPARERELLAHLEGGADLALVTDAGTPVVSDPGRGSRCRVGRGRRHGRADPRGVVGAGGGGGERRRRAALVVRGVPAALGSRAEGAAGADRRRRAWKRGVRGARPDGGDAPRPGGGLRRRACRRRLPRAHQAPRADRPRRRSASSRAASPTGRSRHAARSSSWSGGAAGPLPIPTTPRPPSRLRGPGSTGWSRPGPHAVMPPERWPPSRACHGARSTCPEDRSRPRLPVRGCTTWPCTTRTRRALTERRPGESITMA